MCDPHASIRHNEFWLNILTVSSNNIPELVPFYIHMESKSTFLMLLITKSPMHKMATSD